mmetsp:Transcript_24307/g.30423  ORF Transcript_24307/g.30423 Transcript_24307/m.30423 type:complete len:109 (+) Transcript_24307:600-926(+)
MSLYTLLPLLVKLLLVALLAMYQQILHLYFFQDRNSILIAPLFVLTRTKKKKIESPSSSNSPSIVPTKAVTTTNIAADDESPIVKNQESVPSSPTISKGDTPSANAIS